MGFLCQSRGSNCTTHLLSSPAACANCIKQNGHMTDGINQSQIAEESKHFYCIFLMSLQGKPPSKKATVLNKVNKPAAAPGGQDGKVTPHTH